MPDRTLAPSDICGCGDTGHLTSKTIPIDLAHGAGQVKNVPVYHCRSRNCNEFTLPHAVAQRLEDIAEEMEANGAAEAVFTWDSGAEADSGSLTQANAQAYLQAFTLQFNGREYEDAKVILVVPGQAVFLQSTMDSSEYYLLHYEQNYNAEGIWFFLYKFYYEKPKFSYEDFLQWSEDGYLKELGCMNMEDVEASFADEFGEWE